MRSKHKFLYSLSLFPRPSFFRGVGSAFNVWGNYYSFRHLKFDEEGDKKAMESDWSAIGKDFYDAIRGGKK